jgi:hypothetical protein
MIDPFTIFQFLPCVPAAFTFVSKTHKQLNDQAVFARVICHVMNLWTTFTDNTRYWHYLVVLYEAIKTKTFFSANIGRWFIVWISRVRLLFWNITPNVARECRALPSSSCTQSDASPSGLSNNELTNGVSTQQTDLKYHTKDKDNLEPAQYKWPMSGPPAQHWNHRIEYLSKREYLSTFFRFFLWWQMVLIPYSLSLCQYNDNGLQHFHRTGRGRSTSAGASSCFSARQFFANR